MGSKLPEIVKGKFKEFENGKLNQIRSLRVLYEGGLIGKENTSSYAIAVILSAVVGRIKRIKFF